MMKFYLTYSDEKFEKNRKFAVFMAKHFGNFDQVIACQPDDIDSGFYESHKDVLSLDKGAGYWLWKPYFINKTLEELNDGDFLFYSDTASFMLKSVDELVEVLLKSDQDIMGFELPLIESQWTKKELFIAMDCNEDKYTRSNHIMASFYLIKKTKFSIRFFKELLDYSCNERNITDEFDKNVTQDKDFIDHRHDQSIFSLLYKKYKLKPFKDPSQFGKYPRGYAGTKEDNLKTGHLYYLQNGRKFRYFNYAEKYDSVLFHYRRGNPMLEYIKYRIREALYFMGMYKGSIS